MIFNTLFDKRCFICGVNRVDELICDVCYDFLTEIDNSDKCPICKHPMSDGDINCNHCSDFDKIYFEHKFVSGHVSL